MLPAACLPYIGKYRKLPKKRKNFWKSVDKIIAKVRGKEIDLTIREFDVLKYLASQPGEVVTREMLLRDVWEYEEYVGAIRTIDVTMNRIRDKIEKDKANPKILITKRGVGYYVTDNS